MQSNDNHSLLFSFDKLTQADSVIQNYELLTDIMMHFESKETIKADAAKLVEITSGEEINVDSAKTITERSGETISTEAGTSITVKAGNSISVSAGSKVTLSVGGSTIEITSSSVSITSAQISLNGPITGGGGGGAMATFTGGVNAHKDVTAGGISLMSHVHTEQGDGADVSEPK